jgi:hypothetical protein
MSRRLWLSLSLAVSLLAAGSGAVLAGAKQISPLSVNAASRFANAGLGETHNTANTTEYIECGTNPTTGFCTIRDSSSNVYSCMTTDPDLLAVIRSMSDESYISVRWDAAGVCTYVLSYASSRAATKEH